MAARIAWNLLLVGLISWAAAGCGREAGQAPGSPATPDVSGAAADPFTGTWNARGRTTDLHTGDTRVIEGVVVLTLAEGVYSGSSELETQYPAEGGPIDAHVLGIATGTREGDVLRGTAETQLVMGTVPGLHADFAFVPRTVGARLASTFTARIQRDGTLLIELENQPAEGEENYQPTRTTLNGTRAEELGADPEEG